jgi:hypothetical protein
MSTLAATNLKHASSASNNIVLDTSGNVGIGTASPDAALTVNTVASFGAGAAALPSIAAKGDLNTGLWFPAADTIAASTGGSERLRIDSSGNVGIGTSSPGVKLDVNGVIRSTGTSAILAISKRSTGTGDAWGIYSQSGELNLYDYIAASSRLVIDSSGNVGIGTSSPSQKLVVNSSSGSVVTLIQAPAAASAFLGLLGNGSSFLSGDFNIFHDGAQAGLTMRANLPMTFATNNTERARISSSGYVSIGSTTTNGLLTVDGLGPTLVSQAFAYFAESGGAAVSGYASGQTVTNSIWASSRISGQEFDARSDGRLKKDVTPIPASDAWHFVQNVMPVHYKWINGPDNGHKFGFIAQDVVKAGFPNLIGQYSDSNVQEITDADGFTSPAGIALTVNYDQIVPLLASALRDALAQIDDLKSRLTALEAKP